MTIDDTISLPGIIMWVTGGAGLLIVWGFKKSVTDRIDAISEKLDALVDTVNKMAVKNSDDHGEVRAEIAALRERVKAMRSPWHKDDET